jgi:hypothetical protein
MSYLQNEGKLNNEKWTVIERERNKKFVPKFRTRFITLSKFFKKKIFKEFFT